MPRAPLSRIRAAGLEMLIVDVTPEFYEVPYISSYILADRARGEALVVDPGPARPGCEKLAEVLDTLGSRKVTIYVTHVHIDHAGSVGCLAERLSDRLVRVYAHPRAVPHLADPSKLWKAARSFLGWIAEGYGEPTPTPRELVEATSNGETHDYGWVRVEVLHTPGHASHHQSLLVSPAEDRSRVLFPGDSAGMTHPAVDAVAPTTPPPFRLELYVESLRRQIRASPSLVAYTHVGPGEPSLLERHLRQVERWAAVAASLSEAGDPPEPRRFLDAVAQVDEDTRRFLEFAEAKSRALLEALLHSAMGFIDYIARRD